MFTYKCSKIKPLTIKNDIQFKTHFFLCLIIEHCFKCFLRKAKAIKIINISQHAAGLSAGLTAMCAGTGVTVM